MKYMVVLAHDSDQSGSVTVWTDKESAIEHAYREAAKPRVRDVYVYEGKEILRIDTKEYKIELKKQQGRWTWE